MTRLRKRFRIRVPIRLITLALLVGSTFLAVLDFSNAHAQSFSVSKTTDSNDGVCDSDCSLREAVIAANTTPGRDIIALPAGAYTLSIAGTGEDAAATGDIDITDNLVITGEGAATTSIDGAGLDRVFDLHGQVRAELRGMTVQNGQVGSQGTSPEYGGGILIRGSSLMLADSIVRGNSASSIGGGLFSEGGNIRLTNVLVQDNAAQEGGGIATAGGTLTVTESTLDNNAAGTIGGGVYAVNSIVNLTASTIRVNKSEQSGAGIAALDDTRMTVTQCDISANNLSDGIFNEATITIEQSQITNNEGRGIVNGEGGALTLRDSDVRDNTEDGIFTDERSVLNVIASTISGNQGHGVFNVGGRVTIADSTLSANQLRGVLSSEAGLTLENSVVTENRDGGVYHSDGGLRIFDSTISENTTPDHGGGILVTSSSAEISGTRVLSNTARGDGGGVAVEESRVQLRESTLVGNRAYGDGGGLANSAAATTTLTDMLVADNTANADIYIRNEFAWTVVGGGIANSGASTLEIDDSTIRSNTGRGVFTGPQTTLTIRESTLTQNWEGGIAAAENSTSTVISSTITENRNVNIGAGILNEGGTFALVASSIDNNRAASHFHNNDGGGIFNTGNFSITDSIIRGNQALNGEGSVGYGGGIFNTGVLTLTSSTVSENEASDDDDSARGGGILSRGGAVAITESTISRNIVSSRGGGLALTRGAVMTLTNSLVVENTGDQVRTGEGGGVAVFNSTFILMNSTVSGNNGSGIYGDSASSVVLDSGTIAFNTGGSSRSGGGVALLGQSRVVNTLLAGNTVLERDSADRSIPPTYTRIPTDCSSPLTSGGFNLIQSPMCRIDGDTTRNILDQDPLLEALADNGGATLTHALLPGSPAIDSGSAEACPAADQRGVPRPQDGDGDAVVRCDIGAYERAPEAASAPTPTPSAYPAP